MCVLHLLERLVLEMGFQELEKNLNKMGCNVLGFYKINVTVIYIVIHIVIALFICLVYL